MSDTYKQFIAALHYAAWTRKGISIAGSDFSHEDVAQIAEELETLLAKYEKLAVKEPK